MISRRLALGWVVGHSYCALYGILVVGIALKDEIADCWAGGALGNVADTKYFFEGLIRVRCQIFSGRWGRVGCQNHHVRPLMS